MYTSDQGKRCKSQDLQESITLDQPKGLEGPSKLDGVGFQQQQQFRNPKGISSHSTDTKPIYTFKGKYIKFQPGNKIGVNLRKF